LTGMKHDNWHKKAPTEAGLHKVIERGKDGMKVLDLYVLNLRAGESHTLQTGDDEMCAMVICGEVMVTGGIEAGLNKNDSWYAPPGMMLSFFSGCGAVMYIAAAAGSKTTGIPLMVPADSLNSPERHQIHGSNESRRDVYFTLPESTAANKLMCGVVFGAEGGWTGWPPHQHETSLEEIYCYFDYENDSKTGLHLYYDLGEHISEANAFVLQNGSLIQIPSGYHPTVAMPGSRNTYFWVLAPFDGMERKYAQSVNDPDYR